MKIGVSILSDTYKFKDLASKVDKTTADYVHLDIMDGKFVENKFLTNSEILSLTKYTSKKFDVHAMVKDPLKYVETCAMINTEYFTFHYEAVKDVNKVIEGIKNVGLKPGIAISPDTKLESIIDYLDKVNLVLIMSVVPGKSGQKFMESVLYKVEALKHMIEEKGYNIIINIDGGINEETSILAKNAGVDMMVSASFLHNQKNMQDGIDILKS